MKIYFQQSVPLAGGQAYCTTEPQPLPLAKLSSLAVAKLRNLALVNVQKIPLFTCSRRLLADMSFPPGTCVTVFTPK